MGMTLFSFLEREIDKAAADARSPLLITTPLAGGPVCLTPWAARDLIRQPLEEATVAVWREVVGAAQKEAEGPGRWKLLALWLALPRLRGPVAFAVRRFFLDAADAESEAAAAFLDALAAADPEDPRLGSALADTTCRRLWAYGARTLREVPVVDVAAIAAARTAGLPTEEDLPDETGWNLYIAPPDRKDGLSASLRFTLSSAAVEEVRLTALADRMGLRDTVFRARRPGEGPPIGTLSLRPVGARR
ncbi:hypothetical protein [Streptomyces sp. ISL-86]|uniref:hypothetical protein n=1 Tax=Streptomyces sp. ISL-86 TaxID=2819187 RepID=UPI001BE661A4|nr:hypothetical protein [Streptomyces sp. ISL-86]MBT2458210.1 hypothetical protein [Streptomyces sp. ISL-86]